MEMFIDDTNHVDYSLDIRIVLFFDILFTIRILNRKIN